MTARTSSESILHTVSTRTPARSARVPRLIWYASHSCCKITSSRGGWGVVLGGSGHCGVGSGVPGQRPNGLWRGPPGLPPAPRGGGVSRADRHDAARLLEAFHGERHAQAVHPGGRRELAGAARRAVRQQGEQAVRQDVLGTWLRHHPRIPARTGAATGSSYLEPIPAGFRRWRRGLRWRALPNATHRPERA